MSSNHTTNSTQPNPSNIGPEHINESLLKQWAQDLGFQQLGISDIDLSTTEQQLHDWLAKGFAGDMAWMSRHGTKRTRPAELVPGTVSIISVRMDYRPLQKYDPIMILNHPELAYVSRYALGRDYHKMMRKRLQKLAKKIEAVLTLKNENNTDFQYRVFVDSAPVMEKPIAVKAGLGWQGKHTNVLNKEAGSWFFLGEIYTNLPLDPSTERNDHCGDCTACIDICPTQAIIKPYELDARRCISYLTIEHQGVIAEEFRTAIGNRIYGCDDCQLICPWNRFANIANDEDFSIRHQLDSESLLNLFVWSEEEFLKKMEGSPIRRIGFERWQRNIAIALGNAPASQMIVTALNKQYLTANEVVREHIDWALKKLQ
jgi:epoxyqueuosine reductase